MSVVVLNKTAGVWPAPVMIGPQSAELRPFGPPGVAWVKNRQVVPVSVMVSPTNCACMKKSVFVAVMFKPWTASTFAPVWR